MSAVDARMEGRSALNYEDFVPQVWPPRFPLRAVNPRDALLNDLDGYEYDEVRVGDQIRYYSQAVAASERVLSRLLPIAFAAVAISILIAALAYRVRDIEIWVALATSVAASVTGWIDYDQTESRIRSMASAVAAIRSARERWMALPSSVRMDSAAVARFAEEVEEALGAEAFDWERALQQAQRSFTSART
jgi:hypothetical protein